MPEISGAQWCARYPGSRRVEDLSQPFQGCVAGFLMTLRMAKVSIAIAATWRPEERAYLMHWCCMIAGGADPAGVPPMAGVGIDWTHGGDRAAAVTAAKAMMAGYQIRYPAALVSRHTQRRAVDMTLTVPAGARIFDKTGQVHFFDKACTGEDARVVAIGRTFGVIKLASDPPHWSDDGH